MILATLIDVSTVTPTVEIADILRLYFDDYLQKYHCTAGAQKAPHFQVVFTVDPLVNDLAHVNPQAIYDLLFATANRVLKEFAQRYLGGKVGMTAVLHTWGQTMQHHIHPHCMATGGALASTSDGYVWRNAAQGFLFPVVELSATFRTAFCQELQRLVKRGNLRLVGECAAVDMAKLVQTIQ